MVRKTAPPKKIKSSGTIPTDDDKVWAVVRAKSGNLSAAARAIGVTYWALWDWVRRVDGRSEILIEVRKGNVEAILDEAETATMRNLRSSDGRVRNAAARTSFQYMGKRRGYVPASFVESENHDEVTVRVQRVGVDDE